MKKLTFFDLVTAYKASRWYTDLAVSTRRVYTAHIELVTQYLGEDTRVVDITAVVADKVFAHVESTVGRPTAIQCCRVLARVFNFGRRYLNLPHNPFEKMNLPSLKPRRQLWTPDQVEEFNEGAIALDVPSLGLLARLLWVTGQRPSDIAPLKWDDNWNGREIKLIQQKTGNLVTAPLPRDLRLELNRMLRDHPSRLICACEVSKEGFWYASLRRAYTAMIRDKMGLPQDLQLRDLRRTVLTEAADNGASDSELGTLGGITNRATLKHYQVPSAKQHKNANNKRGHKFKW